MKNAPSARPAWFCPNEYPSTESSVLFLWKSIYNPLTIFLSFMVDKKTRIVYNILLCGNMGILFFSCRIYRVFA